MLQSYVLIYQYFDAQEQKLVDQIEQLQTRVLYRDGRQFDEAEVSELRAAKIKLDFCRFIMRDVLRILSGGDTIV